MGNPFKSKPGSKKLNSPTSSCPLTKGEIDVEVAAVDPRNVEPDEGIEGVQLSVTGGPTSTSGATTPANGRWRYQPLNAGTYTVTPTFSVELAQKYDIAALVPRNQVLAAGQTAAVLFQVPWNWIEFVVQDTAARPLPNLDWALAFQTPTGFDRYEVAATPANGTVYRKKVRNGTHRFSIKEFTNPAWSGDAVIGTEILLTADVDGFKAGDGATVEILDGHDVRTVLEIVAASVRNNAGTLRLEAKWKPAESAFANLKHSQIRFRAMGGTAVAYSARTTLWKNESVKFEDGKGRAVNRQVKLVFTSGATKTITTAGGKADVQIPWGESLHAIELAGLTKARVNIDAGAVTGGVVVA